MENKEWFISWFDTQYYHTLYKNRDHSEALGFIKNLTAYLDIPTDAKVLDLACGKGRHSVIMHQLGFNVLGVDLSVNSIEAAKSAETSGLTFRVHDMREAIDNVQFDVVFNLFTSFGYFDDHADNSKVLSAVHRMLRPGGTLVIDFMNSEKVLANLCPDEVKIVDNIHFQLNRSYNGTHIIKDIQFEDDGKKHHYTERVQALSIDDFSRLLTLNNFEILRTFGDFDLTPFNPKNSDRLIIVAKRG
ncbi:MAG: methyltransferase domain-containing protein [Crocinitomicaceae bacterium]|nr:methyltransferase domain-containing protein [Crocinitomicaceae bacterium]